MRTGMNITRKGRVAACVMVMLAASTVMSFAGIECMARVTRKDGKSVTGMTRYLASSKMYKIVIKRRSGGTMNVDLHIDDVLKVETAKPPQGWETIIKSLKSKRYTGLEPKLEKIRKDYLMMQWDLEAARWLATVYLNTGSANKAIRMCKEVLKSNPNATQDGEFFRMYAKALIETNQKSGLEKLLAEAIATGGRPAAAEAQIFRGDMLMKGGDFKNALVDGYLRNVVLFRDMTGSRAEALDKAIKCFEQLGENNNAEMFRKMLRKEFPDYVARD